MAVTDPGALDGGPDNRDDIDVLSNLAYTNGPPHAAFDWLRANRPLYHQSIDDPILVTESWVVTRHADVLAISRDTDHFGNFGGHNLRNDHDSAGVSHLLLKDRPVHTEHRLMTSRRFTPKVVRMFADHYRDLAGSMLDRAMDAAAGDDTSDASGTSGTSGTSVTFDVVEHLSVEFPMAAIVELMGTPLDDHDRLLAWSNATISTLDPEYAPTPEARSEALTEMGAYALELAETRRANPTDDLATVLTERVDAGDLSIEEYISYVILLFVAGNETTRNNISWGIHALASDPDQYALLRSDPDRYLDSAVEEITRWASPVNYMSRTVHTPVEVHGQRLEAGEKVALMYLAANRDPEVFDDPHRFDITRSPNPQVAFGYGPHFCLGAHLARLETRSVLTELIDRVETMELAGPAEHVWSSFINGIKRLPIRLVRA
ncbi:MAG: cytochrome P450 [Actinomycetota bacterium]